ncbi:hypothetical protein [Nioella sediminis]|jgi:hypothetical protein|uniref:hypothetical protein n=1 Tax=Nioella sediminis TaxID=1912092 RepID=UPI0008FD1189|nr:hypothetical protein [Nioella sediminis]TBX26118.1 hypothetical protein TK43_10465 [Roseovarius sp. JS7-11]
MPRSAFLAAVLVLTTGAAQADNFANIDLHSVESQQTCMAQARQALVILAAENGSDNPDITQGRWSTFGWDLPPRAADISIICPDIDGVTYPFATGHTTGDDNEPGDMIERLAEIFNKL